MLRLFAGLSLPDRAAARLESLQRGLPGRPVAAENLHLTLAFFGETPEPVAADLHAALERLRCARFDLWLDGVGAFGGAKPRNLHARIRLEPALTALRDKVVRAARMADATVDGARFTPHVTLARLRPGEAAPAEVARALAARAAFLEGPIAVTAFHLFRSDLSRHGAQYEALADYPLIPADAPADQD
jgi:2'-5' RNA ligase